MKIAWFTPYSAKSAIARFSAQVVAELSKYAEVTLWHPKIDDERPTSVARKRFRDAAEVDRAQLASYDVIAYNMGNHYPYHGEIWKVSKAVPGIVILHDFVMHHFFAAYYLDQLKDLKGYCAAMEREYGGGGRLAAEEALNATPRLWETDAVSEFPLFRESIRGAYGVVAHSDFLVREVRRRFNGIAAKIPLAYLPDDFGATLSRKELGVGADDFLIMTAGHVNPNKRVDSVLRALTEVGTTGRKFVYAILGPVDKPYRARMEAMCRDLGLEDSVRMLGFVSDDVLRSYFQHADLCVSLRYPATEGASASVIEAMWYGKAIVVTDTGFYSELPDDTVTKIAVKRESAELVEALRRLMLDEDERKQIGLRARAFAESCFQPQNYVSEFLRLVWAVRQNKPVLQFAERIAHELNGLGVGKDLPVAGAVSYLAYDLFFSQE